MHRPVLLAEGYQQVLGEPPVEECADVIDADDLQVGTFANPRLRRYRGSDDAVFRIAVEEDIDEVIRLEIFRCLFLRQEHFAKILAIEKPAEVDLFDDAQ